MKTAEELFKSITGFEDIDVNMLDGVHTTYNSHSSRFEIELDDNRNVSYPFEYCWSKSHENKPSHSKPRTLSEESDPIDEDSDDEFEEMWELSVKQKMSIDKGADFGNEVQLKPVGVISKDAEFGKEMKISEPNISSSGTDEKS